MLNFYVNHAEYDVLAGYVIFSAMDYTITTCMNHQRKHFLIYNYSFQQINEFIGKSKLR